MASAKLGGDEPSSALTHEHFAISSGGVSPRGSGEMAADARAVTAPVPPMPELLERTGFRLLSTTRADCARRLGRSRGTVAFTDEVTFCHGCKWSANTLTLARELGLLRIDEASPLPTCRRGTTQRTVRARDSAGHRRRLWQACARPLKAREVFR